jgi:hypothetical protein
LTNWALLSNLEKTKAAVRDLEKKALMIKETKEKINRER